MASGPPPLKAKPRMEAVRPEWSDVAENILTRRKEYVPRPRHVDPVTLWINELLAPVGMTIKYIDEELRDGVAFVRLIEAHSEFRFADNKMPWFPEPDSGADKLANMRFVFQHLASLGIDLAGDRYDAVMMDEQMSYRTLFRIARQFNLGDPTYISIVAEREVLAAPPPREKLDIIPVAERQVNVAGFVMVRCALAGDEKSVQLPLRSTVGVAAFLLGAAFGRIVSDLALYDVAVADAKGKRVRVKMDRTLEELGMLNGSLVYLDCPPEVEMPEPALVRFELGSATKGVRVFLSDAAMIATFKAWDECGDRSTGFAGYGLKFHGKTIAPHKTLASAGVGPGDTVSYVVVDEAVAHQAAASSGTKRVSEDSHVFLRVQLEETGQAKIVPVLKEQTITASMNEIGVKFEIVNVADYFLRHERKGILKPQKLVSAYKFEQRELVLMCLHPGKVRESGAVEFNVDTILPAEWNDLLAKAGIDKAKLRTRRETMQIKSFIEAQISAAGGDEAADPAGSPALAEPTDSAAAAAAAARPAPAGAVRVVKRVVRTSDSAESAPAAAPGPTGAPVVAPAPAPGHTTPAPGRVVKVVRRSVVAEPDVPSAAVTAGPLPPPKVAPKPGVADAPPVLAKKPVVVRVHSAAASNTPAASASAGPPPALAPKPKPKVRKVTAVEVAAMGEAEKARMAQALASFHAQSANATDAEAAEYDEWGGHYTADGCYVDADGGLTDATGAYWEPGTW